MANSKKILSPSVRSILLFMMLWQCIFNIPDTALGVIVIFVYHLMKVINSISGHKVIAAWIEQFPVTRHGVHDRIIANDITFVEYIVCSACHSLYDIDSCVVVSGTQRYSRKCEYTISKSSSKSILSTMWNNLCNCNKISLLKHTAIRA